MKKLLLTTLLVIISLSMFAQKTIDYTTYDVIAKVSNVTIVVKDNDYRMVIGPLKKSKATFLLGYNKEQAVQKFERLLEIINDENYSKSDRVINFCGLGVRLTIKGSADKERYTFSMDGENVRSLLAKEDINAIKETIRNNQ